MKHLVLCLLTLTTLWGFPQVKPEESTQQDVIRIEPATLKRGELRWKHNTELQSYQIEQYRWNKWMTVDVTINGPDEEGYCSAYIEGARHSGTNTFRIVTKISDGYKAFSNNLTCQGDAEPVVYDLPKKERFLTFSAETQWELYNALGDRILTGTSKSIDFTGYDAGDYYLNFDNYTSKIALK